VRKNPFEAPMSGPFQGFFRTFGDWPWGHQ
jgi:hypothetical protein